MRAEPWDRRPCISSFGPCLPWRPPPKPGRRNSRSDPRRPMASNDWSGRDNPGSWRNRSEEHTSELQSLMRISYAVFCLKTKKNNKQKKIIHKKNTTTTSNYNNNTHHRLTNYNSQHVSS